MFAPKVRGAATSKLPISPLVEEMPGRAEGGIVERGLSRLFNGAF
jgi:hypothetical protein